MFSDLESLSSISSGQRRALSRIDTSLPPLIYMLNCVLLLYVIMYIFSTQDCAEPVLRTVCIGVVVLNAASIVLFGILYVLARFWPDLRSSEPQDRQIRIWQTIESPSVSIQSASAPKRPGTAPAVAPAASGGTPIVPLSEVVTLDGTSTVSSISSHRSGSTEPVASNRGPATTRDSSVSSTNVLPPNATSVVGPAQAPKPSSNVSIASTILPISDGSPTVLPREQTVSNVSLQDFLASAASRTPTLPPFKSPTARSTGSDHSNPSTSFNEDRRDSIVTLRSRTPGISNAGASEAIAGDNAAG